MHEKEQILRRLLDQYEAGAFYKADQPNSRGVQLQIGPYGRDLGSAFDVEDPKAHDKLNQAVHELTADGLVFFEWEPFNKGNLIASIWLNLEPDAVQEAYTQIGEKPMWEKVQRVSDHIEAVLDRMADQGKGSNANSAWITHALDAICHDVNQKKQLSPWLPDRLEAAIGMIRILEELADPDFKAVDPYLLSVQLFDSPSYFERHLKGRLIGFAHRYHPLLSLSGHEQDDESVLALMGLNRFSDLLEFCGPLKIKRQNQFFDFSAFPDGSCLNMTAVPGIDAFDLAMVKRILFVEKPVIFRSLCQSGLDGTTLLFLQDRFPSHERARFLERLAEGIPPACRIDFWGDIDLDGLILYIQLQKVMRQNIHTWRMDEKTLERFKDYATPFSEAYREKLTGTLGHPDFAFVSDIVNAMLRTGNRLDQESFLLKENA